MNSSTEILRVSSDGQEVRHFPFSTDLGRKGSWFYSVDGSGGLFAIFSDEHRNILVHLSLQGEVSRTGLNLPDRFRINSFAVLPDGRSMIFGSTPSDEKSSEYKEQPLTVWLDPSGAITHKTPPGKSLSLSEDRMEGLTIAGAPGTFIQASGSNLTIFGNAGNVIRTLPLRKPTPGSFASALQFVDGRIAVNFQHPANEAVHSANSATPSGAQPVSYFGPLQQIWSVQDSVTGEDVSLFSAPKSFVGSALCYLGKRRFLYLTVIGGTPRLLDAED